ncbi:SlyX family protein [Actinomadura craniellae]|uniref:SlyX family protein n=1 Tax=Actinomadura craniellae TaxID=2231787 RepID=UPI0011BFD905|nr:SlyX family protein [Actinomadura craniellae]
MIVALILAGASVLAAVVVLAMGRGGELTDAGPDYPPLDFADGSVAGIQAELWRLPRGLWGYHSGATDEALHALTDALVERDARVEALQRQVAELRHRLETGGATDEPLPWEEPRSGPWWSGAVPASPWKKADGPAGAETGDAETAEEPERVAPAAEEPR